jgi:hypothetical protein
MDLATFSTRFRKFKSFSSVSKNLKGEDDLGRLGVDRRLTLNGKGKVVPVLN